MYTGCWNDHTLKSKVHNAGAVADGHRRAAAGHRKVFLLFVIFFCLLVRQSHDCFSLLPQMRHVAELWAASYLTVLAAGHWGKPIPSDY